MSSKYQAFPGMDDILPGTVEKWQWVEEKARLYFESFGYREIRTPLLEPTELFTRSIGESTDIVHKEMYTFTDRGDRSMTLRPEMTASVARSVIEKGLLSQAKSLRFYYIGPMFRAERPQAGRKRQFHQIGVEIINEPAPDVDGELLRHVYGFFSSLGLKDLKLQLNDLGEMGSRDATRKVLQDYFSGEKAKLCKDCQWRLEKNVLRILDCKEKGCQPVIDQAPWERALPESETFKKVSETLKAHGIPFEVNRRLVRGLDYYNGVVFEVTAGGLGSQNAVAGGGRYDGLYEAIGGKKTPATGFSLGVERLIASLESSNPDFAKTIFQKHYYLAPIEKSPEVLRFFETVAGELRDRGARSVTTPGVYELSTHLKKANQLGVRFMAILGPEEAKKSMVTLKDLDKREQMEVKIDQIT